MQLNENLQICLLALTSRYPENVVDINEDILEPQRLGTDGWRALDILELLQSTHPEVLQTKARLVLDSQECSIYLVDQSEETPALCIHCEGKIPPSQGAMLERKEKHRRSLLDESFSSPPRLTTIRRR
jgi:hypothetical protein